jgi:hypothetical protein
MRAPMALLEAIKSQTVTELMPKNAALLLFPLFFFYAEPWRLYSA